ncbi:MAG: aminotransferase class V-fold PLP-dependent enzyme [Pseudomonadales bacterium]|jgi:selenocysteine lyase/cysteine desulfurase|nr:aminotransferase class V-fold PLP-dependent enzyme [Pseudomonadales bacterium]MBL6808463.1 aminotransferase class V-fold PLP-dependent enzyme [Pseudomonadales bacterium]
MDRRTFLRKTGMAGLAAPLAFTALRDAVAAVEGRSPGDVAQDEGFWRTVRGDYTLKPDYINLENGYYCFMPQQTLEHQIEHLRRINYEGAYYMRTARQGNKRRVAAQVGAVVGVGPEEVAITRNTTESLDLVIGGLAWQAGDEAVMAEQDYGAMLNHFDLVGRRYGVVNRRVSVPNHPVSDQALVDLYASAMTDKTRLLMISHMINITGQVLPVRKICDMAHARGVEVLVDGAHAYSHIPFRMDDLDCDYYGASLHKWLSAPLGAGLLYVKREKIAQLWPLLAAGNYPDDDIRRLNHTGTDPVHVDLGIVNALEYQAALGLPRKAARLHYLQRYWTEQLRGVRNISVNTPADPARHGGIGNVGIAGWAPRELADALMRDHRVFTVGINRPGVQGLRVTPNVYTTLEELDAFVAAMKTLAA